MSVWVGWILWTPADVRYLGEVVFTFSGFSHELRGLSRNRSSRNRLFHALGTYGLHGTEAARRITRHPTDGIARGSAIGVPSLAFTKKASRRHQIILRNCASRLLNLPTYVPTYLPLPGMHDELRYLPTTLTWTLHPRFANSSQRSRYTNTTSALP